MLAHGKHGLGRRHRAIWGAQLAAHIYIDGHEFELPDVDEVLSGGPIVQLKKGGRGIGWINLGPGCFVTVGEAPKHLEVKPKVL
jgi:hypothetical protein